MHRDQRISEKYKEVSVMAVFIILTFAVSVFAVLAIGGLIIRLDELERDVRQLQGREKHHPTEPYRWNETR